MEFLPLCSLCPLWCKFFKLKLLCKKDEYIHIVIQKLVFNYAGIPAFEPACIAPVYTQALLRRR
jgi:hypothetical protein